MFVLDAIVALFGTAILATSFSRIVSVHSIAGVIRREWIVSIVCAVFVGFFMYRTWRSGTSKWVWTIPTLWFIFGCLVVLASMREHSVFAGSSGSGLGNFWIQLSGSDCGSGVHAPGCRDFFVFTVSFIRAVSYSTGAFVSSRIYKFRLVPATAGDVPNEARGAEDSHRA
jgi:hypothetical protein